MTASLPPPSAPYRPAALPPSHSLHDFLVTLRLPLRLRRRVADLGTEEVDQLEDPGLLLAIDLVRRVGGSVVVLVRPIEEEQDGDALPGEVVVVGAEVEPLIRPDVVDRVHLELGMRGVHPIESGAEIRVLLPDHADRVAPLLDVALRLAGIPADHVEVDVGDEL